jgi:hypothetical protein
MTKHLRKLLALEAQEVEEQLVRLRVQRAVEGLAIKLRNNRGCLTGDDVLWSPCMSIMTNNMRVTHKLGNPPLRASSMSS